MKRKFKLIVPSFVALLVSVLLIAGSTFALFTSQVTNNITVKSATVEVSANFDANSLKVYSAKAVDEFSEGDDIAGVIDDGFYAGNYIYELQESSSTINEKTYHHFVNNDANTATGALLDGNDLSLINMTAGDKVKVKLGIGNSSNVDIKYRVRINLVSGLKLFEALKIKLDGVLLQGVSKVGTWTFLEANSDINDINIELYLPLDNEALNSRFSSDEAGFSTKVAFTVEAVQANAKTVDETLNTTINVSKPVTAEEAASEQVLQDTAQLVTVTVPANAVSVQEDTTTSMEVKVKPQDTKSDLSTVITSEKVAQSYDLDVIIKTQTGEADPVETKYNDTNNPDATALKVKMFVGTGLKGIKLYHKTEEFTKVASLEELDAKREFYYDSETGYITLMTNSFSEYTVVYNKDLVVENETTTGSEFITYKATEVEGLYTDSNENSVVVNQSGEVETFKGVIITNGNTSIKKLLPEFRDSVNEGNSYAGYTVTLTSDIDLNNIEWTPIGTPSHPFSGVFDGAEKTISNFTINSSSVGDIGLFGYVKGEAHNVDYKAKWDSTNYVFDYTNLGTEYSAVVKNLIVDHANVVNTSSKKATAAVIGSAIYSTISNITLKNSNIAAEKGVGGIIGNVDASFVEKCTSDSNTQVLARSYNVGGIIGNTANDNSGNVTLPSMIYNCSNYATIIINGTTGYAGGVLGNGQNGANNVVADCINYGKVKAANTNLLTSPEVANSGIAGIAGSANGIYLLLNCVNEESASFEVVTSGEGVVQEFFNSVAGIAFYGSGKYYHNCINKADFTVAANKIAGITVSENSHLYGCENSGQLVNTLIPSATYELASDMKVINIENMNFDSIAQLNAEIESQFNSVGGAVKVSLKNVTINNLPGTGTLVVPEGIQTISSNVKVCDNVEITDSLSTINMVGLTQTVSGNKSLYFGGSNNEVTVLENTTMNTIVLDGNNNHIVNNGTLNIVNVRGNGNGLTIVNNGEMHSLGIVASTASTTFTNNGTMSSITGNAIHVEAECTLIINNNGTISSNSFAILLYDGCNVTINASATSATNGMFAPYRGNNTINIYYHEGATLNNGSWTAVASTTYNVTVSVVE